MARMMPPPSHPGYAGLSSKRQQHEKEENYLHHVTRLGNDSEALRTQREVGLAAGRAGVPAELTTHAHGIGRRPMSGSGMPVFRTEALSGGAVAVMEVPQAVRPSLGRRDSRPMAQRTHLDMSMTPRDAEAPSTARSHGNTFRSSIEGGMHVGPQQSAEMPSKGQGRRRMQGPPTTVHQELVHPPPATPRALCLSSRDAALSGAQTARTYGETNHKYREFATRSAGHTSTDAVLNHPHYLVAPYGTDTNETPRPRGRHMAQPSTFDILG